MNPQSFDPIQEIPSQNPPPAVSVPIRRANTLRHAKEITWLFENRKNLYVPKESGTPAVRGLWAIRPLPVGEPEPILFLTAVSKKSVRKAHDRNQLRRWIREALRSDDLLPDIIALAKGSNSQILLNISGLRPPSNECYFSIIKSQVHQLLSLLRSKLRKNLKASEGQEVTGI